MHQQSMDSSELEALAIYNFYLSMSWYLHPESSPQFANQDVTPFDIEAISLIAGDLKVRQQGGLRTFSCTEVFTLAELVQYLEQIAAIIERSDCPEGTIAGMMLGDLTPSTGLTYEKGTGLWTWMSPEYYEPSESKTLFSLLGKDPYLTSKGLTNAFHITIVTQTHPKHLLDLHNQFRAIASKPIAIQEVSDQSANAKRVSIAALQGDTQLLAKLIAAGVPLNVAVNGVPAVHLAAQYNRLKIIEQLGQAGADLSAQNYKSETPAHIAAQKGNLKLMQLLVSFNANLTATTYMDVTPLHLAVQYGHLDIIQLLQAVHINLNESDSKRKSPLLVAAQYGQSEVVEFLLKQGCNPGQAYHSNAVGLRNIGRWCRIDVKERIEILIRHRAACGYSASFFPIYPCDMAYIMGHEHITNRLPLPEFPSEFPASPKEKKEPLSPQASQLAGQLQDYIQQVERKRSAEKGLRYGFSLFPEQRGLQRAVNVKLAEELVAELNDGSPLKEVFGQVNRRRLGIIRRLGLETLNYGIHSTPLKAIIEEAKKISLEEEKTRLVL